MRSILNISLPEEMAKEIKREVKAGQFSSVSEFIRAAVRAYKKDAAIRRIRKGDGEFAKGETTVVSSFAELRKFR